MKDYTHIRWLLRHDMPEVLAIEVASFPIPWAEDDFMRMLRQRNCIGVVAERNKLIVGYMIYTLQRTSLDLVNFAVHPDCRRFGIGRALVDRLRSKLSHRRRTHITAVVSDKNLDAQLFFRAMGFRAVQVLREHYDTGDDGYLMRYTATAVALPMTMGAVSQELTT